MSKVSLTREIKNLERIVEKGKLKNLEEVITSISLSLSEIKRSSINQENLSSLEEIYRNINKIKDELDYRDKLIRSAALKSFFFNLGGWASGIVLSKIPYTRISGDAGIASGIFLGWFLYFLHYYPKFRECKNKILSYSTELENNLKRFASEIGISRKVIKIYPFVYF